MIVLEGFSLFDRKTVGPVAGNFPILKFLFPRKQV